METHRTRSDECCPACGHELGAASNITGETAPDPGDISVCAYCASILTFDDDLNLEPVPSEEARRLRAEHPDLRAAQNAARILLQRHTD